MLNKRKQNVRCSILHMKFKSFKNQFSVYSILYVAGALFILFLVLLNLCTLGDFDAFEVLRVIAKTSYNTHQNIIFYLTINRFPLTSYIYIAICCGALAMGIFNFILERILPDRFPVPSPLENLKYFTVILLCVLNIMQLFSIRQSWKKADAIFSSANIYERTSFSRPKQIAEAYRLAAGDIHYRAQFVSDMDMSRDPGMLEHRSFAFFLYPIDVRNIYQKDFDAWIAYEKDAAESLVPDGYKILHKYNARNVLAIRTP
ncbi:MAG: hypothetical protein K8I82_12375 [Anaerolineae bacterium]|nr:hypothetical protein [Anaerolineae bacterium]